MINFDDLTKENIKKNPNWPESRDYPYRILKVGGSWSEKKNALLNLTNREVDIDKIYLYAKDLHKAKYRLLIKKRKSIRLKYLNDSKLLLKTWIICMIFIKILKKTTQIENVKHYFFLWYGC